MLQQEFTRFYNKLHAYAYSKAGRYFRDAILRDDAACEAVNSAVDAMVRTGCYDLEKAKRRIQSTLRHSSRKRELEPTPCDMEGFHGYEIRQS